MIYLQNCPDCRTALANNYTCADHFHQLLAWETDHGLTAVHHLTVLCYYLQHPSLYSPEGLAEAKRLLVAFVEDGATPGEVRAQMAAVSDSAIRAHKITGTLESFGQYDVFPAWQMHMTDVTAAGINRYYESVELWAASILMALRESGNLD